jgi:hypothetical protein
MLHAMPTTSLDMLLALIVLLQVAVFKDEAGEVLLQQESKAVLTTPHVC